MNLEKVLQREDVKKGLLANLFNGEKENLENVLSRATNLDDETEFICDVEVDGNIYTFENKLFINIDPANPEFLLDSRLFRKSNDSMAGVYLEIFDKSGNTLDEPVDDVDEYATWVRFRENK